MRWVLSDHSIFCGGRRYVFYSHHEQRPRPSHLHHLVGSRMAGVRRPSSAAGELAARADSRRSARDGRRDRGRPDEQGRRHLALSVGRAPPPHSRVHVPIPGQPRSTGSSISKTVRPGALSTEIVPPWRSTIALTIDSPSPLPPETPSREASAL